MCRQSTGWEIHALDAMPDEVRERWLAMLPPPPGRIVSVRSCADCGVVYVEGQHASGVTVLLEWRPQVRLN